MINKDIQNVVVVNRSRPSKDNLAGNIVNEILFQNRDNLMNHVNNQREQRRQNARNRSNDTINEDYQNHEDNNLYRFNNIFINIIQFSFINLFLKFFLIILVKILYLKV